MAFTFGPRRATYVDISESLKDHEPPLSDEEVGHYQLLDVFYRSLCALMYNYVPMSGHPGGSISSGRFVSAILFDSLDYDFSQPDRWDADIISYAAGHKAMGLYAMWALRDEAVRLTAPEFLPDDPRLRIRLEDLLGFRRNPSTTTPLFLLLNVKALDGHPTPQTPFVRLSTGASGVGVSSSLGLAIATRDYYGPNPPIVHIVEGEGGLTPGRVAEALATAGTACLGNVILHLDWNQASIDTNHVCREDGQPGEYVQWNPMELFHLHDWNVIYVPDGRDFRQIVAAQRLAPLTGNGQPTAVVYRTVKGWQYGIEGRASHGAGHKLCSAGFYQALAELTGGTASHCLPASPETRAARLGLTARRSWKSASGKLSGSCAIDWNPASRRMAYFHSRLVAAKQRLDSRRREVRPTPRGSRPSTNLHRKPSASTPQELHSGARNRHNPAWGVGKSCSSTTTRPQAARSLRPPRTCLVRRI